MLSTLTGDGVAGRAAAQTLDWNMLTDDMQLWLSREALRHAAERIAGQAEVLAGGMEAGWLADRGGADALRLLASVVRITGADEFGCAAPGYAQ